MSAQPTLIYRPRVLVAEDNKELWRDPMVRALKKQGQSSPHVFPATNASEALALISEKRIHVANVDQEIPSSPGDSPEIKAGLKLSELIDSRSHTTYQIIYTAYAREHLEIPLKAGRIQAEILEKSSVDAERWAVEIGSILKNKYVDFCIGRLEIHLPDYMASIAGKLAEVRGGYERVWHWLTLWEATLLLHTLLALALARRAGVVPASLAGVGRGAVPQEPAVREALALHAVSAAGEKRDLGFWNKYCAPVDNPVFLEDTSPALRQLRNEMAHGHVPDDWRDIEKRLGEWIFPLLDATSFWADTPLVTGVRDLGGGRFEAERIRGSGWPWHKESFSAYSSVPVEQGMAGHVYVLWPAAKEGVSPELIDLWPWVSCESAPQLNRRLLWLVHRGDMRLQQWQRVGLHSGKPQSWVPGTEALRAMGA